MFLFKRNKIDAKAEKLRLIHRIEGLQTSLIQQGLQRVSARLDKVISLLDDKYLSIRKEQIILVDMFLSDIEAHANKQYETLLMKKCDHITSVIRNECEFDERAVTKIKNEDRLYEMLGELSLIDEQIKILDKKMDAALGTDKNLWNMLNAQRHTLKNRAMIINKNYQTLLESQSALSMASEVKKARDEAESIMRDMELQNVAEFEENAEFTAMASDDVRESTEKMQEIFNKTYGGSADSYEYEHALEKKLLESSPPSTPNQKVPVSDQQDS